MKRMRAFGFQQDGAYSGIACVNLAEPYARNLFVNNYYEIGIPAEIPPGTTVVFYFGTSDPHLIKASETFVYDPDSSKVAVHGTWGIATDVKMHFNEVVGV
ncbi:MAG: hypothetical protein AAFQ27_15045 [Pseudomonadota bacterium]